MTDTNHIEVLCRQMDTAENSEVRAALRAAITALSARASAGEGRDAAIAQAFREVECGNSEAAIYRQRVMKRADELTAAPQLAQAGASGGGVDEKHLADCLLMTGHLSREQAEEVASKLRAFVFTPVSPATGDDPCIECGADPGEACYPNCCTQTPQPAAAQHWSADSSFYKDDVVSEQDAKECFKGETLSAAPQPQEAPATFLGFKITEAPGLPDGVAIVSDGKGKPLAMITPAHGDGEEVRNAMLQLFDLAQDVHQKMPEAGEQMIELLRIIRTTRPTPEEREARDAVRYRWLREQNWFDGQLCVLRNPKKVLTSGNGLGADCPSRDRLDEAIDAALALPAQGEGK